MELRSLMAAPTAKGNRLEGYAARFDAVSELISERGRTFRETIRRGAFAPALASGRVVLALWNHGKDGRPPLGSTPNTLRVWEDAEGLRFELDLPASAADVREAVERGDVKGMSFAFRGDRDRWTHQNGTAFREVLEIGHLVEISPVIQPAYPDTSVGLRSAVVVPDPTIPLNVARARLALADRG